MVSARWHQRNWVSSLKFSVSRFQNLTSHARRVVKNRLPINIGTLCDFLDRLCALLILSSRVKRLGTDILHNLTLPRSWMVQFVLRENIIFRKTEHAARLLEPIAQILTDIHLKKAEGASKWSKMETTIYYS